MAQSGEIVTSVVVPSTMTAEEAHQCITQIKGHLNSVRLLLLDLDERRGLLRWAMNPSGSAWLANLGDRSPSSTENLRRGSIEREISLSIALLDFDNAHHFL